MESDRRGFKWQTADGKPTGREKRIMVIVEVITPPLFMIVILCKLTAERRLACFGSRNVTRRNKKL